MHPSVCTKPEEIKEMAEELQGEERIAIDTEFVRETTFFPKIALLQVATPTKVWLIDPLALQKEGLAPLLDICLDPNVLKIMHAAYADQECLYWAYNMIAEPVLDTAVGAALIGIGDNIGLGKLTREILNVHLPKGRARAKWLKRPLTPELLKYAEHDVRYLVELGKRIESKLKKKDRWEWALEESQVPVESFDPPAEQIAQRLGRSTQLDSHDYPVLLELVQWREKRARKADLPRNWVADNETLMSLAKIKPKTQEDLRSFRGLNGREVEKSGPYILEAILRGLAVEVPPQVESRDFVLRAPDDALVSYIQTYIDLLARDLEIAPRFLLTASGATRLAQGWQGNAEKWVSEGILSPRARELIGFEMECLVRGQHGLVVEKGRVKVKEFH
jgi:ribonuclease D